MSGIAVEFDFVEDAQGQGRFVAAGDSGFKSVAALALKGDVDGAARLYEEAAPSQRALIVQEAALASATSRRALLQALSRARDFAAAANLAAGLEAHEEAAQLFEAADQLEAAAAAWQRGGNTRRAGAVLERMGDFARALELYRSCGDREGEARALSRTGRHFEAAQVYRALQNAHAELQLLLSIAPEDPQRRAAVLRASELLDESGHPNRALPIIYGEMKADPKAMADFAFQTELVRLLRRAGREEDAQRVLSQLQRRVDAPAAEPAQPPAAPAPDEGYAFLKALPLFAELSLGDMKDLFALARRVAVPDGMVLIQKGARDSGLYVLLEGEVEVFGEGGRLLNALGPGAYLGEISLLLDAPTTAQVKAKTKVKALLIPREPFGRFLDTHEAAARRVWRLFAHSLAERVRALSG